MTYTPDELNQMALNFTRRQSEALAALELPRATVIEMFEMTLDLVADNLNLCEHGWDVFASACRIEFYGISEVPGAKRRQWVFLYNQASDALYAADPRFAAEDEGDYRADLARDERLMGAA
jgi:hypothetical protein